MNRARRKNKKLFVVGSFSAVAIIIGLSMLQLGKNSVYFFTPKEAVAQAATLAGQNIKIGGMVKSGTVTWEAENLALNFTLTNYQDTEIAVSHTGSPPDMFKEGQGVVVEGKLTADGSSITSKNLMVKHSEEYQMPDDHGSEERQLLMKDMFKNEKEEPTGYDKTY